MKFTLSLSFTITYGEVLSKINAILRSKTDRTLKCIKNTAAVTKGVFLDIFYIVT